MASLAPLAMYLVLILYDNIINFVKAERRFEDDGTTFNTLLTTLLPETGSQFHSKEEANSFLHQLRSSHQSRSDQFLPSQPHPGYDEIENQQGSERNAHGASIQTVDTVQHQPSQLEASQFETADLPECTAEHIIAFLQEHVDGPELKRRLEKCIQSTSNPEEPLVRVPRNPDHFHTQPNPFVDHDFRLNRFPYESIAPHPPKRVRSRVPLYNLRPNSIATASHATTRPQTAYRSGTSSPIGISDNYPRLQAGYPHRLDHLRHSRPQLSPFPKNAFGFKSLAPGPSLEQPSSRPPLRARTKSTPASLTFQQASPNGAVSFEYQVLDPESGNNFGHQEKTENGVTQGFYYVQLPGQSFQRVSYSRSG